MPDSKVYQTEACQRRRKRIAAPTSRSPGDGQQCFPQVRTPNSASRSCHRGCLQERRMSLRERSTHRLRGACELADTMAPTFQEPTSCHRENCPGIHPAAPNETWRKYRPANSVDVNMFVDEPHSVAGNRHHALNKVLPRIERITEDNDGLALYGLVRHE